METTTKCKEEIITQTFLDQKPTVMDLLYDCFSPVLYGVIVRTIGYGDEANDALQDVFVKIWNNSGQYDPKKAKLYTWMLNITRNHCIDFLRSKASKQSHQTTSMTDREWLADSESTTFNPETLGLREIVDSLPTDQHQVIEYIYFQGYTQQEVADELDIPLGTVKSRLRLAMKKLRTALMPSS